MKVYRDLPELYDYIYGGDISLSLEFLKWLIGYLDITKDDKIVDIGAGTGGLLIPLTEIGYNIEGIEPYSGMRKIARKKAKDNDIDISIQEGSFQTLEAKSKFDLIFGMNGSMQYLGDIHTYQDAFNRIYEALKPNGYFVVDLMNFISIIKYYDHPEPNEFEIDGKKFVSNLRHEIDLARSIWHHKLILFIEDNNIWQRVNDHHELTMITLRELKIYAHHAGLEYDSFYSSYKDRDDKMTNGSRLIVVFRKPHLK